LIGFTFALLIFKIFGMPNRPSRGSLLSVIDPLLTYAAVIVSLLLIFLVVDAIRLCRRFVFNLAMNPTKWPERTLQELSAKRGGMQQQDLDEWIDIEVIAKHTAAVGPLIYYPFIVMAVMIIARNSYFDNWRWSVPLAFVVTLNLAYALYSAILLRATAEDARKLAVKSLTDKLWEARGSGDIRRRRQIELTLKEIEENREGAFAKLLQHSVFRAVLIPFGGAGLMSLIEYVENMF
jgi:hypothetical protein